MNIQDRNNETFAELYGRAFANWNSSQYRTLKFSGVNAPISYNATPKAVGRNPPPAGSGFYGGYPALSYNS